MKCSDLILNNNNIRTCIDEIAREGWDSLVNKQEPLPNKFISASNNYFLEQFYWDSFFISLGLKEGSVKEHELAKGIVENFFFMLDKKGYIPNSYHKYDTRSQTPYLTSMIGIVDKLFDNREWLKEAYDYAVREYENVWVSNPHITSTGLSKYHDSKGGNGADIDAENESGWDLTSRFLGRASKINAIDLNSNLFKYEHDFLEIAMKLEKSGDGELWRRKMQKRKALINQYMWNEKEGLFFDYDFEQGKKVDVRSLAVYSAMWAGLASREQAKRLVSNLELFEYDFGLATCDRDYGFKDKQWNYPNGWAPLQFLTIEGLKNYGYHDDADRLAYKWLKLCADNKINNGSWDEKYSVVKNIPRTDDNRYTHQTQLSMTKGVFIALFEDIQRKYQGISIAHSNQKQ
jgi:alpha,alpha-trehalase|tara:strand:- start:10589 stop:11797 length:1209 start_codon:yes stop_codon:yes gene_type:complete